jgi:DNA-binding transcriptional LysR family regulator
VPRVVQEASNDYMQMSFIAAGIGIGFVNASMARRLSGDVVLRPVAGLNVTLTVELVWPRLSASPALLHFVDMARQVGAGLAGSAP